MRRAVSLLNLVGLILLTAPAAGAVEGETFAITRVDFDARTIDITNYGEAEVDPNGLTICNFPNYQSIRDVALLAPGESMTVDLRALGIPIDAAGGELALYLEPMFDDSEVIVAYVEWGTPDHQRSPVAQAAAVGGVTVWDGAPADGGASALEASADFPTSGGEWTAVAAETAAGDNVLPVTGMEPVGWVAVAVALIGAGAGLRASRRRRA